MCYRPGLVAIIVLISTTMSVRGDETKFALVGYLPQYRLAAVQPERLAPLTDLIYFGLEPPAEGKLESVPLEPDVLRKLQEIKRIANCRLLLCVGGWNRSAGFASLAKHDDSRRRFIASMLAYCQQHGFDGIDYDWEHPRGADEMGDYQSLLRETKAAFHKAQLQVTVAQATWQDLGAEAYQAVDRVHLMSYDHAFPQATFDKSTADVERLLDWGCPPGKLALGLPFYGRNQQSEARTYAQLVSEHAVDANHDLLDGFAFNGKATIARKIAFAKQRQLAGMMIWELGQDATDPELSLLTAIAQRLQANAAEQGRDN